MSAGWFHRYFRLREVAGLRGVPLPSDDPRVPRDCAALTPMERLGQFGYVLRRAKISLEGFEIACCEARYEAESSPEFSRMNEVATKWLRRNHLGHRHGLDNVSLEAAVKMLKHALRDADKKVGAALAEMKEAMR